MNNPYSDAVKLGQSVDATDADARLPIVDAEHREMLERYGVVYPDAPRAYSDLTPRDEPRGPWTAAVILVATITVPGLVGFVVGLITGVNL